MTGRGRGEFYDDYKITYRHYLPTRNRARDVGVGIVVVDNGLTKGKCRSLNLGIGPDGDFTEPRVFDVDVERF